MDFEQITKVEADDPWRCQSTMKTGQCPNKATSLGGTCLVHGGNSHLQAEERKRITNYKLNKFRKSLERHASSPKLKTLNDEVAILRMLLEEQLNQCADVYDLTLKSHIVSDLVVKLEKLVKSCHTLEVSLGGVMDKNTLISFATDIIEIISSHVEDEAILTAISNGILALVDKDQA